GDEVQLRAYLDQFRADGWPPIRGVVHAAAVFESDLLTDLDASSMAAQLRPKVVGAWLLGELLGDLDLFVLFSSIASVLPQPGQGAYVAGNAFLDAFAEWRAARGLHALSVNWGLWAGTDRGLLGEDWQRPLAQMEAQGFRSFRVDQGLDALARMLGVSTAQAVFVPIDWRTYDAARPSGTFVSDLVAESRNVHPASPDGATRAMSMVDRLAEAAPADRYELVEAAVRRIVGRVLQLPEAQIDAAQPLGELGLDSMTGVDLRNRLEAEFRLKLSATLAWNYPAVADLAGHLLGKLGLTDPAPAAVAKADDGEAASSLAQLIATTDDLDDDDAIRALMGGLDP
ncbi:MAG: hypothetical protein JWM12_446, partial [Ilumatobacteraceae bacterium]|nr:hypothetical protein [Ilumatobacteraceae bacterium]